MGKGKRVEEPKGWQKVLSAVLRIVPLLCVVAVLAFFFMIMDMNRKLEDRDYDVTNIVIDDTNNTVNNTVNNTTNNTVNNVVDNDAQNNTVENIVTQPTETNISGEVIPVKEDKDIQEARKVFNDFWGNDENSNIEIYKNDNNDYMARVTSKETGNNQYFVIDVANNSVSEY